MNIFDSQRQYVVMCMYTYGLDHACIYTYMKEKDRRRDIYSAIRVIRE